MSVFFNRILTYIYIFITVLYCHPFSSFPIPLYKPILIMYKKWMERMFHLFPPCYGRLTSLPLLWGSSICNIHNSDARDTSPSDLEWWNWNRTVEKRRSSLGKKIKMEEYSGCIWAVFHWVVLPICKTHSKK